MWILFLFLIPSTRKNFIKDLNKIKYGMTSFQVESIMGKYIKGTGWPSNPCVSDSKGELCFEGMQVYRHNNHEKYNSDWGVITYNQDKVVSVEFSPD